MNDEDIQYLGRRSPLGSGPLTPGKQQRDFVTGFILHIEKSATESEYELAFWRSDHSVIHIGRRPANPITTGAEPTDANPDNAMFRCAVVSRKHAKIVFSDSGTVYIVDTNSHHGTHILKADSVSAVSKQLPSETPTQLSNGDIITFGKTVGRTNEFVSPIVARVELMYAPTLFTRPTGASTPIRQTSNNDKTIDLTLNTPPPTVSPLFRRPPTVIPSPMRRTGSNSGRYGLNSDFSPLEISSSSSSESDDDSVDHGGEQDMSPDSDIEEITPASGANALPILRPRVLSFSEREPEVETPPVPAIVAETSSRMHKAFEIFEVLKNLIPPVSLPGVGPSNGLPRPPSPPHALMAQRELDAQESSQEDVAEVTSAPESLVRQAQLSEDFSLYRPLSPLSRPPTPPARLIIESTSEPMSPSFSPTTEYREGALYDIFDAPGSPRDARSPIPISRDLSPFYSPYSSCGFDLPPFGSPPSLSPLHTPLRRDAPPYTPTRQTQAEHSFSLQPDSIFTQGFLDKEKERAAQNVVDEAEGSNPWTANAEDNSSRPSPPSAHADDFEAFHIQSPHDFSFELRHLSGGLPLSNEANSAHLKDREDSPMELESVDGDMQPAVHAKANETSAAPVEQAKKKLSLSERLTLEREELERRLRSFRRVTSSEDRDEGVESSDPSPEPEIPTPASGEPLAAPSLSANKAMSLDSICSSDGPVIMASKVPVTEPSMEVDEDDKASVDGMKEQIKQPKDDVQKAQVQQRRTKARFARSIRAQSEKISDLDDKVDDVVKQCMSIGERMDSVMDMDMPDLVGQVEGLRELVESRNAAALQDVIEKNHDGLEKERKGVMEHVDLLKSLVEEMRQLKCQTEEQMKAELDAVRVAKEEALKAIEAHVKMQLAQTPSPASAASSTMPMNPVSLKRKRNDDGEDSECGEDEAGDEGLERHDDEDRFSTSDVPDLMEGPMSQPQSPRTRIDYAVVVSPPPRKRARTIAGTAAKTATAVTVGAIAAWSALAFS